MGATHEVSNQPPALVDYAMFDIDTALVEGIERHGAGAAKAELSAAGRVTGSAYAQEQARLAHLYPPVLGTHDKIGRAHV